MFGDTLESKVANCTLACRAHPKYAAHALEATCDCCVIAKLFSSGHLCRALLYSKQCRRRPENLIFFLLRRRAAQKSWSDPLRRARVGHRRDAQDKQVAHQLSRPTRACLIFNCWEGAAALAGRNLALLLSLL